MITPEEALKDKEKILNAKRLEIETYIDTELKLHAPVAAKIYVNFDAFQAENLVGEFEEKYKTSGWVLERYGSVSIEFDLEATRESLKKS